MVPLKSDNLRTGAVELFLKILSEIVTWFLRGTKNEYQSYWRLSSNHKTSSVPCTGGRSFCAFCTLSSSIALWCLSCGCALTADIGCWQKEDKKQETSEPCGCSPHITVLYKALSVTAVSLVFLSVHCLGKVIFFFFFFFCSSTLLFSFLVTIIVLLLWSVWKRLLKREWRVANGCLMWMKWKCIEFCLNFFCLFLFVSAFSSKNILRSVVSEYLSPQTLYVLSKKTCTSYQSCSLDLSPALLECTVTNTLHVFTSELL